jgi:hypothetical protein
MKTHAGFHPACQSLAAGDYGLGMSRFDDLSEAASTGKFAESILAAPAIASLSPNANSP